MASLTLFPLQFKRQDNVPIDIDSVFATTADRVAYLASPRRYGGQVGSDLEQNLLYVLNAARDTWLVIGGVTSKLSSTLWLGTSTYSGVITSYVGATTTMSVFLGSV